MLRFRQTSVNLLSRRLARKISTCKSRYLVRGRLLRFSLRICIDTENTPIWNVNLNIRIISLSLDVANRHARLPDCNYINDFLRCPYTFVSPFHAPNVCVFDDLITEHRIFKGSPCSLNAHRAYYYPCLSFVGAGE